MEPKRKLEYGWACTLEPVFVSWFTEVYLELDGI